MKRIVQATISFQAHWYCLFPVRPVRITINVYLFIAVFAPLLSSHDPLAVYSRGKWTFPAFSHDPYFENEDGSMQLKAAIDWRKRSEDFVLFPLVPYSPDETDPLNNRCVSPLSAQRILSADGEEHPLPLRYRHWLGTTFTGKDVLCLLIHGCRTSLLIGLLTMLLTGIIAFVFGGSAGWAGNNRWRIGPVRIPLDTIHTNVTTAISGIPRFLLVLILSAAANRSIGTLILILSITGWPELSRSWNRP
jgi:ABC-type dipeptide/oligopeptide/nickel transport system permease subunit